MGKNRTSISKAQSYKKIVEFWDTHDLANYWNQTEPVGFEVDIRSEITLCAIDRKLSKKVRESARKRGISSDTLVNLWIQEKLQEESAGVHEKVPT